MRLNCGVNATALGDELVETEGKSASLTAPEKHLFQGVSASLKRELGLCCQLICPSF